MAVVPMKTVISAVVGSHTCVSKLQDIWNIQMDAYNLPRAVANVAYKIDTTTTYADALKQIIPKIRAKCPDVDNESIKLYRSGIADEVNLSQLWGPCHIMIEAQAGGGRRTNKRNKPYRRKKPRRTANVYKYTKSRKYKRKKTKRKKYKTRNKKR